MLSEIELGAIALRESFHFLFVNVFNVFYHRKKGIMVRDVVIFVKCDQNLFKLTHLTGSFLLNKVFFKCHLA